MSLVSWTVVYIVNIVFWLWIFFLGGADLLGDTPISGIFIFLISLKWRELNAEGIKFFGIAILILHTLLFLIGLVTPEFRALFG